MAACGKVDRVKAYVCIYIFPHNLHALLTIQADPSSKYTFFSTSVRVCSPEDARHHVYDSVVSLVLVKVSAALFQKDLLLHRCAAVLDYFYGLCMCVMRAGESRALLCGVGGLDG
jgi:hypothetical protein